jgi:hypothetical protein
MQRASSPEPSDIAVPLPELKNAHQELITHYIGLLDDVAHAPRFLQYRYAHVTKPEQLKRLPAWLRKPLSWSYTPSPHLPTLRYLVHLFVEGHIRRKLKELSEAYLYLSVKAAPDAKEIREWTKEVSELCEKLAGTLASWSSVEGLVKLLWPLALGGLTAWLGVKDIWEVLKKLDTQTYLIIYGFLLFPVIWLSIFMSNAFSYKRAMFIPGFDAHEQPYVPGSPPHSNVYLLEDRLFGLLGRDKMREGRWDRYFIVLGCLIFGSVPVWGLFVSPSEPPTLSLWLCGGFFWMAALFAWFKGRKRQWQ